MKFNKVNQPHEVQPQTQTQIKMNDKRIYRKL